MAIIYAEGFDTFDSSNLQDFTFTKPRFVVSQGVTTSPGAEISTDIIEGPLGQGSGEGALSLREIGSNLRVAFLPAEGSISLFVNMKALSDIYRFNASLFEVFNGTTKMHRYLAEEVGATSSFPIGFKSYDEINDIENPQGPLLGIEDESHFSFKWNTSNLIELWQNGVLIDSRTLPQPVTSITISNTDGASAIEVANAGADPARNHWFIIDHITIWDSFSDESQFPHFIHDYHADGDVNDGSFVDDLGGTDLTGRLLDDAGYIQTNADPDSFDVELEDRASVGANYDPLFQAQAVFTQGSVLGYANGLTHRFNGAAAGPAAGNQGEGTQMTFVSSPISGAAFDSIQIGVDVN